MLKRTNSSKVSDEQRKRLQMALQKSRSVQEAANKKPSAPTPSVVLVQDQKPMAKKIQKPSIPANPSSSQLTPLQKKMHKKLAGAKFRWINEQLYTTDSSHAVKLFKEKPEMFRIYHEGFRSQVEEWPTNPVDVLIRYLRTKGPETVVADMGCGDGKIAQELHKILEIHSFDLVAPNKFITACDIAHVPLKAGSVDIVIFCLSLMGVNFMDFLQEAFRILKDGGELRIAEVSSRFPNVEEFIGTLSSIGFIIKQKDTSNKVFTLFQFKKKAAEKRSLQETTSVLLKPCLYKKR